MPQDGQRDPKGRRKGAQGHSKGNHRTPKFAQREPKGSQKSQKEPKVGPGTAKGAPKTPKGSQRKPKGKIYIKKLPINRPSGRYVIIYLTGYPIGCLWSGGACIAADITQPAQAALRQSNKAEGQTAPIQSKD